MLTHGNRRFRTLSVRFSLGDTSLQARLWRNEVMIYTE